MYRNVFLYLSFRFPSVILAFTLNVCSARVIFPGSLRVFFVYQRSQPGLFQPQAKSSKTTSFVCYYSKLLRSYKNYDRDKFLMDLSQAPFHMVHFFESLYDQVDAFNCLFLEVLNDYAPIKCIKIKSRPNPFITQDIK